MCRSIKTLHNFEPPATDDEVRSAALQYVRKIAGTTKPSKVNAAVFDAAAAEVTAITRRLVDGLTTQASPRNREEDLQKRRERFAHLERGVAPPA